jgi:hypothetical protein
MPPARSPQPGRLSTPARSPAARTHPLRSRRAAAGARPGLAAGSPGWWTGTRSCWSWGARSHRARARCRAASGGRGRGGGRGACNDSRGRARGALTSLSPTHIPRIPRTHTHRPPPHLCIPVARRHVEARELVVQPAVAPIRRQALYDGVQHLHARSPGWGDRARRVGCQRWESGGLPQRACVEHAGNEPVAPRPPLPPAPAPALQRGPQRRALPHAAEKVAHTLALHAGQGGNAVVLPRLPARLPCA